MPREWIGDLPAPLQQQRSYGDLDTEIWDLQAMGSHWYGDASGGDHSSIPVLRRCAHALVHISTEQHDYALLGSHIESLAGDNQTVNRSEMWPAIHLASRSFGDAVYHTDSQCLSEGFAALRHLHPKGSNADLWWALDTALEKRRGSFVIVWVKAHKTTTDIDYNDPFQPATVYR